MSDESKRADVLLGLMQQAWANMKNRQSFEWKIAIAIWTALAAFTAALWTSEHLYVPASCRWVLLLVLAFVLLVIGVSQWRWCCGARLRTNFDRDLAIAYAATLEEMVNWEWPEALQRTSKEILSSKKRWWSMGPQLAITFLLCFATLASATMRVYGVATKATPPQAQVRPLGVLETFLGLPVDKVHCFYGTSASLSSRHTALNGDMFAAIIEKDEEVICKVVFSHKAKFYKSIIRKRAVDLKGAIRVEGTFTIDDAKIPFHLELKGGNMLGEIDSGLDKGIIVLKDFDTK